MWLLEQRWFEPVRAIEAIDRKVIEHFGLKAGQKYLPITLLAVDQKGLKERGS